MHDSTKKTLNTSINLSHILNSPVAKEQVLRSVSTGSVTDSIIGLLSPVKTSASHFLPLWEWQWRCTGRVEGASVHPSTQIFTALPPYWQLARPQCGLCPVTGSGNGPWGAASCLGAPEAGWLSAGRTTRVSPAAGLFSPSHPHPMSQSGGVNVPRCMAYKGG